MNFVCLKWGTKYSAEFVNKLYGMIRRHYPAAELYCMTEDPSGINERVRIIPLPDDNLEKWWWKIYLFNEEWMTLDNAVFLDLDLIIQKRFDIGFGDKPKLLYTDWIDVDQMSKDILTDRYRYCEINSSVLAWNKYTTRHHIWEDFQKNRDKILCLFKGMDNYLNNRMKDSYEFLSPIAHSYWTTGKTWADVPIILFDYEQAKQDEVDEPWVHAQWKE